MKRKHQQAKADPSILRLSLDAKATVKVGPFSRGGKNRIPTEGSDHDFHPKAKVTPYGIFLPSFDELFLYLTPSRVTSDFIVDRLEQWWKQTRHRFSDIKTLLLNVDNGPESHSRRTQLIKRMVEFAHQHQLNVQLAYYPPYHSKYNPIERTWAALELHWNGQVLDEVETVMHYAQTMTWQGKHPSVTTISQSYDKGVRLSKAEMKQFETQLYRESCINDTNPFDLGRWFVYIPAESA